MPSVLTYMTNLYGFRVDLIHTVVPFLHSYLYMLWSISQVAFFLDEKRTTKAKKGANHEVH